MKRMLSNQYRNPPAQAKRSARFVNDFDKPAQRFAVCQKIVYDQHFILRPEPLA